MNFHFMKIILVLASVLVMGQGFTCAQTQRANVWGQIGYSYLSWDEASGGELFDRVFTDTAQVNGQLVYKDRDFVFSFAQSLSYSEASDYFVLWVAFEGRIGVQMIRFSKERDSTATYKAVNGIDARLEDLGRLKLITTAGGSSLLFALAGDNEWRLVSLTSHTVKRLFVDYTAEGLIEKVHGDGSRGPRELVPEYQGGAMVSVMQSWYADGNKVSRKALLR